MDRSLTYFDDVAAIKVSLHLMQKRSGVPFPGKWSRFRIVDCDRPTFAYPGPRHIRPFNQDL
jgi:hypothetical protein